MGKRPITGLLAAVMLLTSCLSACGNTAVDNTAGASAGAAASGSGKIEVTDLAGKTYSFDKPLDKVIIQWSGSGGPFMTMSALFGKDVCSHIAAMDDGLQKYRMDMYEDFVKSVPELAKVKNIGSMDEDDFDLEGALSSGAQAAIVPIGLQKSISESIQPKLEAAGIPVVYMDYHAETLENHTKSVEMLGNLFGKEDRAKELIDFYTSHVNPVYTKTQEILKTKQRPKVYIEVGMKGPSEYGNSFSNTYSWGCLCYNVGGTSIGDGVLKEGGPLEPEYVLSSNPDKIIFTGSYWPSQADSIRLGFESTEESTNKLVAAYLARQGWNELNAVKNGEIYVVHHGVGREIYDCASIEALAKFLYSDEFADLNPTKTLQEFYQKFLPYEFSGVWYMKYTA